MTGVVATAETDIDAPPELVWSAITDPAKIKQYMFGTDVSTDWQPGSSIVWRGEYEGKSYEDKGAIIAFDPVRHLELTHFSPLSGQPDEPENYHTLTYDLEPRGGGTHLSLSQDNNADADEAQRSRANWDMVLAGIKQLVERG
jgi:uncharacterized protein YndB with AHSA1/START domain